MSITYTHVQGTGTHGTYTEPLSVPFLSPVTAGNLVVVSVSYNSSSPPAITDDLGNTYTLAVDHTNADWVAIFYSVVITGGSLTVTASSTPDMSIAIDEYSFTDGALVVLDPGQTATGTFDGSDNASTGPLSPSGTDLIVAAASCGGDGVSSIEPGAGFTATPYGNVGSYDYQSLIAEYALNVSTEITPTMAFADGPYWVAVSAAFKAAIPPIFPSPNVIPENHAGHLTITLTGSGTTWSDSTVFTATGAGVTLVSHAVTTATAATLVVTTGSSTGVCTISDGTYSQTITVVTASFTVLPTGSGESAVTTVTAHGTNTLWLSEPGSPPLFSVAGVTGAVISDITVVNNVTATLTLTSGTGTGVATVTDSSTTATTAFTVYSIAPTITIAPWLIQVNVASHTFTLTGIDTNWISGTTNFSLSGVSGVTLVSQSITSTTAATLVISTGASTGAVTVTDGDFNGSFSVILATVVNQSYVSRNGQMACFCTTATTESFTPTFTVIGTSVTDGGSGYTSPTATLSGGGGTGALLGTPIVVSGAITFIPVIVAGTGYTSAATIAITDPHGTGATATAVMGGPPTEVTAVNANPTISVNGHAVAVPLYLNSITVTDGGAGYTSATTTVAITGGSGGGATASPNIAAGVVTGFNVTNAGWGYRAGDTLAVTVTDSGVSPGSGATGAAVLGPVWTQASHDWSFVPYQMLCGGVASVIISTGGSGYSHPVATATGGGGTGLVLGAPVVVNGVIKSISVSGSAANGNPITITDNDGSGSGFIGFYTVSGGEITGTFIENGGSNYSTNLTASVDDVYGSVDAVFGTVGNGGIVLANGVIQSVPVTDAGSGYTSSPAIAIADSDGGAGSGATVIAFMSGPAPTDVVTFSAPDGWLTTTSGSVPASVSVPMMNFAGQLEPFFAEVPRTMQLGVGAGNPYGYNQGYSFPQNWLKGTNLYWAGAYANLTITPASGDTTGANAAAHTSVNSSGVLTAITIDNPGSGYRLPPIVTIDASPGTQATATATISGGLVTAITLSSPGYGGTHYAGSTLDGHPISINSSLNWRRESTGSANAFDSLSIWYNNIPGIWTYTADESNPGPNAMVVELNSGDGVLVNPDEGYPTAGTMVGSVAVGRTWQWTVPPPAEGDGIGINISGPSGLLSAPWTHSNEFMCAPLRGSGLAQTPNRSVNNAPNPNIVSAFTLPNGRGAAFGRLDAFGNNLNGDSNVVDASDLSSVTAFGYQGVGSVSATVVQIRKWDPSVSPYIWTNQNHPGTSAVAGGPAAYAWPAPANLNFLSNSPGTFGAGAEFVTSAPHGLKSGQKIAFNSTTLGYSGNSTNGYVASINLISGGSGYTSPPTVTIGGGGSGSPTATAVVADGVVTGITVTGIGSGSAPYTSAPSVTLSGGGAGVQATAYANLGQAVLIDNVNGTGTVIVDYVTSYSQIAWVTGPNSFLYWFNNGDGISQGPDTANVDSSNDSVIYNFTVSTPIPSGGCAPPYEVLAAIVAAVPGMGAHFFIPAMATDACVAAIAATIRDILPVGRPVILEYMDEYWNDVYPQYINMYVMAALGAGFDSLEALDSDSFHVLRQSQICNVAIAVFNEPDINGNTNRGGSIIRAFGGSDGQSGRASNIAGYANTYNATSPAVPIRIDALMIAPYRDFGSDQDILLAAAAASTYSNFPGSTQYGSTSPWSMGMYADLVRHDCLFDNVNPYFIQQNIENISAYNLVSGQTEPPYIICYEGTIEVAVQTGMSNVDWAIRDQITKDLWYHPWFYDAITAYYLSLQEAGCRVLQANSMIAEFSPVGYLGTQTLQGIPDYETTGMYPYLFWEGQTWGKGDGTADGNGNLTTNLFFNPGLNAGNTNGGVSQDLTNVSPKMQGWRDWAAVSNVGTALAVGYTLTGPTGGPTATASTVFTITPASTVTSDTVSLSAGAGGGTFSPSGLTFTSSSAAQTFTYTPGSVGVKTLTVASAEGGVVSGSPWTYTSSSPSLAVSYTIGGATFGAAAVQSANISVTPAGTVASDTVSYASSVGGDVFSPTSPLTFTSSSAVQNIKVLPATGGARTITFTSADGGVITGSPWTYTSVVTSNAKARKWFTGLRRGR